VEKAQDSASQNQLESRLKRDTHDHTMRKDSYRSLCGSLVRCGGLVATFPATVPTLCTRHRRYCRRLAETKCDRSATSNTSETQDCGKSHTIHKSIIDTLALSTQLHVGHAHVATEASHVEFVLLRFMLRHFRLTVNYVRRDVAIEINIVASATAGVCIAYLYERMRPQNPL